MDNYSKTSGCLWQYYRDETTLNNKDDIANIPGKSASFISNVNITEKTLYDGNTKYDVKIAVPLKYLSNFGELLKCL